MSQAVNQRHARHPTLLLSTAPFASALRKTSAQLAQRDMA